MPNVMRFVMDPARSHRQYFPERGRVTDRECRAKASDGGKAQMKNGLSRMAGRTAVLAAVALSAATLTSARPAYAAPTGCNAAMLSALTVSAYCQGGTGQFRAKAFCDIPQAPDKVVYGTWRPAGGPAPSQVSCPWRTRSVVPSLDAFGPA
jgi:hypothetical protein